MAKTVGYQVLRLGLGLMLLIASFRLIVPNTDFSFGLMIIILTVAVVAVSLQGINVISWW